MRDAYRGGWNGSISLRNRDMVSPWSWMATTGAAHARRRGGRARWCGADRIGSERTGSDRFAPDGTARERGVRAQGPGGTSMCRGSARCGARYGVRCCVLPSLRPTVPVVRAISVGMACLTVRDPRDPRIATNGAACIAGMRLRTQARIDVGTTADPARAPHAAGADSSGSGASRASGRGYAGRTGAPRFAGRRVPASMLSWRCTGEVQVCACGISGAATCANDLRERRAPAHAITGRSTAGRSTTARSTTARHARRRRTR